MTAGTRQEVDGRLDELLDVALARAHEFTDLLLSRAFSATAYRRLTGGVPPVQLQALAVLATGDMRMRDLAHRLGLATSTVTRLVDRLEAAGLAERRNERPDRRSVLVGLSTAGRDALAGVRRRLRTLLHELIGGLSPAEQGELLRLLTKVGEAVAVPALEPAEMRVRVR